MSALTAPDGRTFRVFTGRCICAGLGDCWQARCECGEALTKHDFDRDGAIECALSSLASEDTRPGFGHPRCKPRRRG